MRCSNCGYELKDDMNFCPKCGTKVISKISNSESTFIDDRDGYGKVYNTVKIGKQVWMAENLDYAGNGGVYYKDAVYPPFEKAGRLYTCQQAMEAVPSGWHLPNNDEWAILMDFVGGFAKAGKDLKATNGWDNHDRNFGSGTDKYGFAALPGGFGILSINSLYGCIRGLGFWWSATEVDVNRAYYYCIYNSRKGAYLEGNHKVGLYENKTHLYSVRCVQD